MSTIRFVGKYVLSAEEAEGIEQRISTIDSRCHFVNQELGGKSSSWVNMPDNFQNTDSLSEIEGLLIKLRDNGGELN